jgi:ATP/maltotriose-dependent transcriptional regulator MalT
MYDSQKNYNMSLQYYKKALNIKIQLENEYAIAASLTNLGITYYNLGDLDQALTSLQKAYDIYKNGDYPEKWIRVMNNIGEIYIAKEDGVQASRFFEKALKEDTLINDQKLRVKLIGNYGHALLLAGDYKNAEKQLNEALEMSKVAKSYSLLAHVYRLKSKMAQTLAQKNKDFDLLSKSIEYSNMSIAYNDSMINEENIRSVAEMQAKYEYEKNKRAIQESKLVIAKKEQKIQKNKANAFFWTGLSVILFLIVIITFSLYFFKQRKNLLMKGQMALIENQKIKLEQLNQKVKDQLDKTVITLNEKEELLENVFSKSKTKELPEELLSLSKREMEVLSYLALGWSDDMLAEKLFVSKSTIKTHLRRIYSKLLVKGRTEAVAVAHRYDLLGDQVLN